jgi:uncharacterized protein (DUF58 family)
VQLTLAGGTEPTDHRDYTSGDDYRYVDWNRAARHDELVSKQYHGTTSTPVYLLLDCGRSMQLESDRDLDKLSFARMLAGAVGYVALTNHDLVRVAAFSDQLCTISPVIRGARSVRALMDQLNRLAPGQAPTDLRASLDSFVREGHPPGLVVLVSDLLDPAGFVDPLDKLRRGRFQLHVTHIYASADADPGEEGRVTFEDISAGRTVQSRIDRWDLMHYQIVFRDFCAAVRSYCSRYRIPLTQISTRTDLSTALQKMLQARERL